MMHYKPSKQMDTTLLSRFISTDSKKDYIAYLAIVTECLTSDIFSMLLCGVSDCIIVFSIVLAP